VCVCVCVCVWKKKHFVVNGDIFEEKLDAAVQKLQRRNFVVNGDVLFFEKKKMFYLATKTMTEDHIVCLGI
jgi:hypothetical protein